jgi:hypothetical protein
VRLPLWALVLVLFTGVISTLYASGFFQVLMVGLLIVNLTMTYLRFKNEVGVLKAYIGHGPVDKAALRKDAMQSLPIPVWMVATLLAGSLFAVFFLWHVLGILVGLLVLLLILGVVAGGAYFAYKALKSR